MLIIFICGLSPEIGHKFIDSVIEMRQNDLPFGEECPDFCWAGWATSLKYIWVQLSTRKAENITPFILKCLWEMRETSTMQKREFPFKTNETAPKEVVSLQPDLNFEMLSFKKVNQLYEMGAVKFDKGNVMHLYNLNDDESIKEDPNIPFQFFPDKTTEIFCLHNLKCKCRYDSLVEWLGNQKQLVKVYMSDINMPPKEMKHVLKTIGTDLSEKLRILFLRDVDLNGAEKELCNTISQLPSLYYFSLRKAKMGEGCAASICKVFSDKEKFKQLKRLDLSGTDLSSAKEKLSEAITRELKELKLNDTNMTKTQTQDVCSVVASNTSLISLGLSKNNLSKAVNNLASQINKMVSLKDLNISSAQITKEQMLKLVQNLPQSITALFMWELKAINKKYKSEVVDKLKALKKMNLKVVQMNLSEEIALCLQHSLNLEVCTTSDGVFEKPEIAKCLRMIAKEYDKFTSQELRTEKAKMQN